MTGERHAARLETVGASENVKPGQDTRLVLGAGDSIAGRVVNTEGTPVANALVGGFPFESGLERAGNRGHRP